MTRQEALAQTKQLADLWYEQYTPMLLAKQVIERKKKTDPPSSRNQSHTKYKLRRL